MQTPESSHPWYAAGLRFACTRCGDCCRGGPGTARATDEEVRALAEHVGLDEHAFRDRYTRRLASGGTTLRERPDHACVFWHSREGCLVYAARPRQCRTWPFWRANDSSEAHWTRAAQSCPGIGAGALHDAEHVRRTSEADGTSGIVRS